MPHRLLPASRRLVALVALALAATVLALPAHAAQTTDDGRVVDILELSGPIDPPTLAAIGELIEDANVRAAELVVLTIDAPGAVAVDVADVVRPLVESQVPVAVWVGPGEAQAGGAASFLVAAAHVRAMSSRATLGPACPASTASPCDPATDALARRLLGGVEAGAPDEAGWPRDEPVGARLAAERGPVHLVVDGREPLLIELDGRQVETADGVRTLRLRSDEVTVRLHELGPLRRTLHATLTPSLAYLLVVASLLLLLFELFQPGFGVAGVAGLLLLPLTVYGLIVLPVAWWALALLVVGLLLLALDLALAGLGWPTLVGTAVTAVGSWFLFGVDTPLALSPWLVGVVVATCVLFFVVVMTVVLRAQAGPDVDAAPDLVGQIGVVRSTMNPEGHVFVDGALWRGRWTGAETGRIRAGTTVRVRGVEGAVLLVDDADAPVRSR
ncbi:MAG TPA: NfeD family protein [Nitriliruptorales bacterium]|nr:NfeD family protein [Nitriliruptorales bacterium]